MITMGKKTIWIDLDNSPHVPFFNPIIQELTKKGYKVIVTARDCFQVMGLCKILGLQCTNIGKHWGKNKLLKILGTLVRALQLVFIVLKDRPAVAVAHGSRSMLLASKALRIKSIVFMDYEFSNQTIPADYLVVPKIVYDKKAKMHKSKELLFYNGIKEDIYVPSFKPDINLLKELGITPDQLVVTVRPPATEAHYHNPESEVIFTTIVNYLNENANVRMIILPRSDNQRKQIIDENRALIESKKMLVPSQVYDGLNIIWNSDVVISGGGTMNREAAALQVPVYSIFRGKIGAVDKYLCEINRLVLIESPDDVRRKIVLKKRDKTKGPTDNKNTLLSEAVEVIEKVLKR